MIGLTATSTSTSDTSSDTSNGEAIDDNSAVDIRTDNGRVKLKFTDLHYDVLYLIVEQIEFIDDLNCMFSMTEISSKLTPVISAIFRRKYPNIKIIFNGYNYFCDHHSKTLKLYNFDVGIKAIEKFGSEMQRIYVDCLSIDQSGNIAKSMTISQFINKYAKSVKSLNFDRPSGNIFQEVTEPFEQLQELSLFIDKTIVPGRLPMNEIYPQLRRLELSMLYFSEEYSVIDCEFSHLEFLRLSFDDLAWKRSDQIKSFLKKNAHVKSVHLLSFPKKFLKELPELLPNIENLTLNIVYVGDDPVRLENVKHCTFYNHIMYMYGPTENILLPQLESLELTYTQKDRNVYTKFLDKHTNLKRLHLKSGTNPNGFDTLAVEVALKSPNLVEIILEHSLNFNIENIQQLIDSHSELVKIKLSAHGYSPEQLEIYRPRFENEWNIYELKNGRYNHAILFERKY